MPILEVELVQSLRGDVPAGAVQILAERVGELLGAQPGHTWVKLRRLARADYAESGGPVPDELAPVFVTVLEAAPPAGEALAARTTALARTIGEVLERSASEVHVLYLPPALGRIAFGGRLRLR
jgi:phenylpyruvate tautomerase PptA (4-oxalocrotonate tautomerase family)